MTSTGVSSGRVDVTAAEAVSSGTDAYSVESMAAVKKDAKSLIGRIVRENPLSPVAVVAAIAFVYGATR